MKKIVYVLILVAVIALGIIVAVNLKDDNKSVSSSSENIEDNKINDTQNNVANNNENNTIENATVNNESQEQDVNNNGEGPKTDLEKAIDIVKKDWGEDNSVYFAEDGQTQNGEYIICVRDNNTTSAMAWYTVNVQTGQFVKE